MPLSWTAPIHRLFIGGNHVLKACLLSVLSTSGWFSTNLDQVLRLRVRCGLISSVQSLSCVRLFATPWIAAHQASLSITNSRSSLRLTSIESVMPSSHLGSPFTKNLITYLLSAQSGFPGGAGGKEPTCQCRRHKRYGFGPWVWRIPSRRAWQPTSVFLPGESLGQRSLAGYSP